MDAASIPAWLADIHLVTFDCFGTLIDWRSGLGKVGIEGDDDFADFERRCLELQESERHVPYARILMEAITAMRPGLRRAIVGLFADDFGRLPAFPDSAGALASLAQMVQIGVLSNSDANHQLDVMSTLRAAWDLCITSQDIRAYKPTDRAWDTIVRMGVARTAVHPENWLHVSGFLRYDLGPARARRLRTCLIDRPGGDSRIPCDLEVGGLGELVQLLAEAKDGPLLLELSHKPADGDTAAELRRYLVREVLDRMRAIPGVRGASVIERDDGALVEQHTFGGRGEYDGYVEAFSAELRGDLRARFGDRVQTEEALHKVRGRA